MKPFIYLISLLLSGCGAAHVIPGDNGKPESITESGYTSSGCIESLQEKAVELGVKIRNIKVINPSSIDTAAMVYMWPMVKGVTCTADVKQEGERSITSLPPPTVDVTGKWTGVLISNLSNDTITENLIQNGAVVVGIMSASKGGGGTISGTVTGNNLLFTITPTGCTGSLSGTAQVKTNVSTGKLDMSGTYTGIYVCNGKTNNESGSGTVTKQ